MRDLDTFELFIVIIGAVLVAILTIGTIWLWWDWVTLWFEALAGRA